MREKIKIKIKTNKTKCPMEERRSIDEVGRYDSRTSEEWRSLAHIHNGAPAKGV